MPYRNDQAALEALRDELRRDLADATRHAEALAGAVRDREELARELAGVEAELARARARRVPLLESVRIASPCSARWEEMKGDERVRFCGSCEKDVYNLSAMTSAEAEALLAERGGNVCVRLYRRADGTVMTTDCPVGVRRKRVKRAVAAVAGAGAMTAAAALFASPGRGWVPLTKGVEVPEAVMGGYEPPPAVTGMPTAVPALMGTAEAAKPPPAVTGMPENPPPQQVRTHRSMGRPSYRPDAVERHQGRVLAR